MSAQPESRDLTLALVLAAHGIATERVEGPTVLLDDPTRACLIEEGSGDVFAVRIEDGEPRGRWTFLYRAEEGSVADGTPPHRSGLSLLVRLTPGSTASFVPRDALQDLGAEMGEQAAAALDPDIHALCAGLHGELPPREFVHLDAASGVVELEDGGVARPVEGNVWVEVERGTVDAHVCGTKVTLEPGGEALLTEAGWVVARGAAAFRCRSTAELLADRTLRGRLDVLYDLVLDAVAVARDQEVAAEEEALQERVRRDSVLLEATEREFSSVLESRFAEDDSLAHVAPALAVATMVGREQGIEVQPPRKGDLGGRSDPIESIARASRFRTRPVRLEPRWWTDNVGPLVGFLRVSGAPVALIRTSTRDVLRRVGRGNVRALRELGTYVMHDPELGTAVQVGPEQAHELKPEALQFYRPLPERPVSGRDLVTFGARGSKPEIVLVAVGAAIVAALSLLTPILTGKILGGLVPRAAYGEIVQYVIVLLIAAVAAAIVSSIQNLAALRLEGRVDLTAQAGVWDRLLGLPASFFRRYSIGDLSNAALGINSIRDVLSGVAVQALMGVVFMLVNLGLMLYYSIGLGLVALAMVGGSAVVWVWAGLGQVRRQREIAMQTARMQSVTFQIMSGVSKIRVAAAEERAFAFWARAFTKVREMTYAARVIQNRVLVFNATYAIVSTMAIFAYIAIGLHGKFSTSKFLTFNVAFASFVAATLQLTAMVITVLLVVPLVERLRPILREVPEVDDEKEDPGELAGRIEVSHVAFRYAEGLPLVLKDVSFTVAPGEFVAVVGSTGCGKSTLLRLLLGFERPENGSIFYDGQDLADLDATSVRRQCGVVLQNGQVLAGDILSNIVGSSRFTVEDAWDAAEMAGLKADIENMPMGMNTLVSEGSGTLSGGQRQRLMIARALIAKPRIVFFDEATSALDNKTQEIVTESMRRLNAARVVIAHRLSTIRDADRIVVLQSGDVVQMGTFDELMGQEGLFRELASRQIA